MLDFKLKRLPGGCEGAPADYRSGDGGGGGDVGAVPWKDEAGDPWWGDPSRSRAFAADNIGKHTATVPLG